MAFFTEIRSTMGNFDCWVERTNHIGKALYAVEVKRKNNDAGGDGPTPIEHAFFNMYVDEQGTPRVLTHSKYPLNIYWKEIEKELGNYLVRLSKDAV